MLDNLASHPINSSTLFDGDTKLRLLRSAVLDLFAVSQVMLSQLEALLRQMDVQSTQSARLMETRSEGANQISHNVPRIALDEVLENVPALLQHAERHMLFSMILGLRPRWVVEVGTHQGGSALIMVMAMNQVNFGNVVCIDPAPIIKPETWELLKSRTILIEGFTPDAFAEAHQIAGNYFDFAFIDGDHTTTGVICDIEGVLPYLQDGAYLLFHDAFNVEVQAGIDQSVAEHPNSLIDCGMITRGKTGPDTQGAWWAGLRLLRYATDK